MPVFCVPISPPYSMQCCLKIKTSLVSFIWESTVYLRNVRHWLEIWNRYYITMYKVYSILTSLVLSVVTASRTLHPTPFKSCVFFLASCHFFCLQLSSCSQQKHFSSALLISSHNVTIDKNWSLTFVRFLVCFLLLLLLFSLIFSNVKYFLLWIWSHFFTFNIFLLFFSNYIFFKHHFHFFASSGLHKNAKKYSLQLNL